MTDPRNTERDEALLTAAATVIRSVGLDRMDRGQVADAAGCSRASVSNYGLSRITTTAAPTAGVLDRLRDDVMARAVEQGDLELIAIGVGARHPVALAAPRDLQVAALAHLI